MAVNVAYGLICVVGLAGNGLVVFVITRFVSMKTVTNLYILNLSVADGVFLLGVPLLITTHELKRWIFGPVMCRVFYVMNSVNTFTGTFTLVVMSADRYLAICHPITAISYRTTRYAVLVIAVLWAVSLLPMTPILMYAGLVLQSGRTSNGTFTCTVDWPARHVFATTHLYIIYNLILSFAVPTAVISVFYCLLVVRLHRARPVSDPGRANRSSRRHPKVTRLVTLIIAVYVGCWMPYWIFQIYLITDHRAIMKAPWKIYLYHVLTLLSYANSMVNPLLYAFTNHNFRESFAGALGCRCARKRGGERAASRVGYKMANVNEQRDGVKIPPGCGGPKSVAVTEI